jgi:hypothetical protein
MLESRNVLGRAGIVGREPPDVLEAHTPPRALEEGRAKR